jgi:hypothetical protein
MSGLPLHAAVVHIPLGVAVVVPEVLVVLLFALVRRKVTRRSFLLAALLQTTVVGGGLLALSTGKAEKERVEAVVGEAPLERHQQLATLFLVAAGATLVLVSAAGLAPERLTGGSQRRGRLPRRLRLHWASPSDTPAASSFIGTVRRPHTRVVTVRSCGRVCKPLRTQARTSGPLPLRSDARTWTSA